MEELSKETKLNKSNIRKIKDERLDILSLDEFNFGGMSNELQLIDVISDEKILDPKAIYYRDKTNEKIQNSIDSLDERSSFIIKHYFGLGGETKKNFAQIAEMLNLSRERIRQIHKEALRKIFKDINEEVDTNIDYLLVNSN
jgi:RNA polymerase primary sigma factor